MMYSCGSTCRMRWSAGMATALAASITCVTSTSVTSRSRIATTPCEFRLRTWLPAIPANTEWISHPAISSASSTARWIDCTVDSMLTTTPFLRPRDGCEPMPSTSMPPSAFTSPTSATTFDVPMSRPTIKPLSDRLAMVRNILVGELRDRRATPPNCKTVGVAHVDIVDVGRALRDDLDGRRHESFEAIVDLPAAEPHGDAVGEIELPRPARIEAQRRDAHAGLGDAPLRGEVTLCDFVFRAVGAGELRQFQRHVTR